MLNYNDILLSFGLVPVQLTKVGVKQKKEGNLTEKLGDFVWECSNYFDFN